MDTIEETGVEVEARKLAIEAIAKLVNYKRACVSELLRPAGVPEDIARDFLTEKDPTTGGKRSKREAAVPLLDALKVRGLEADFLRQIVGIAARWEAYHLAAQEFEARAVVSKAKRLVGALEEHDERERRARVAAAKAFEEASEKAAREKQAEFARQMTLLLQQFDYAQKNGDAVDRGYLLEDLMSRLFVLSGIPVTQAFRRNSGGEQIDGAFFMDGWHYLLECRWRDRLSDTAQLDALNGKVGRSGYQTMGVFLSINGWSHHVVPILKQNPTKRVFLMEGYDLRCVLSGEVNLKTLIDSKLTALNLYSEPFHPVTRILQGAA